MESQFGNIHKLMEETLPTQSLKNLHDEISQISRTAIDNAVLLGSGQSQVAQMVDKFRESSQLLSSLNIENTATLALESIAKLNIPSTAELALGSIANLNITDTYEKILVGNLLAENVGKMQDQLHSPLAELEKSQFEVLNQHRNLADELIEQQRKFELGNLSITADLAKEAINVSEILANYSPDITLSSLMKEAENIASFSKYTNNLFQSSLDAIDAIRGNSSIYDLLSTNIDSINDIVKNDDEFSKLKNTILEKEKFHRTNISKKEIKLKQTVNFYAQFLEVLKLVTKKTKSINLSTSDYIALVSLVFTLMLSQNSQQNNNVTTTNITNNITNHYGQPPISFAIKEPKLDNKTKTIYMRQISGSNVILRYQPSRQSDFIEYLQNGEKLQILDNTNRKWLQVKVKVNNGYLEGWVFRRYTKRIKK